MTGKDAPLIAFLRKEPAVRRFLSHAQALLAEAMAEFLRRRGDVAVEVSHRGEA